jgi:hypothetical protein
LTNPAEAAAAEAAEAAAAVGDELAEILDVVILTALTGELGAEFELTSFMVPFNFEAETTSLLLTITLELKLVV